MRAGTLDEVIGLAVDADPGAVHKDLRRRRDGIGRNFLEEASEGEGGNRREMGGHTSRFSMVHSSRNWRIGSACVPTEMYDMRARFFTSPHAWPSA